MEVKKKIKIKNRKINKIKVEVELGPIKLVVANDTNLKWAASPLINIQITFLGSLL